MRKDLMMNGVGVMAIIDNKFYITNDEYGYECYIQVNKSEFIEELKKMSYGCLTSWDKQLRQAYLDLVEYTKEMK